MRDFYLFFKGSKHFQKSESSDIVSLLEFSISNLPIKCAVNEIENKKQQSDRIGFFFLFAHLDN